MRRQGPAHTPPHTPGPPRASKGAETGPAHNAGAAPAPTMLTQRRPTQQLPLGAGQGAETRVLTGLFRVSPQQPEAADPGALHEDASTGCPSPWVLLEQDHTHTHTCKHFLGRPGCLDGAAV